MDKKINKTMKPWLIAVIAAVAVAVIAGAVFLILHFGNFGKAPVSPNAQAYTLYWNLDGLKYSSDDTLSRPRNDDDTCTMRFFCDGQTVELKVESRRLATNLDNLWSADGHGLVGLIFNEDGIVTGYTRVKDMPLVVNGRLFYVQTVAGKKVKLNSTSTFIGMEEMIELTENTVVYDMSGASKKIGEQAKLQVADQVMAISNLAGELTHVFIVNRDGIIEQQVRFCEHCKQEIQWTSWVKDTEMPLGSGHYYLTKDVNLSRQQNLQEGAQLCVDLNGYTVTGAKNTRVYVNYNAGCTLSLMDLSAEKTGRIVATVNGLANSGFCVWVRYGAFNFYSGTLDASGVTIKSNGAAVNVAATTVFNMHGGTIIGGNAIKNDENKNGFGGSVNVSGTFNMYGGTITGGTAQAGGGNICGAGSSVINMMGGEVVDGTVTDGSSGGNIYVGNNSTFNLKGGTVSDGIGRRSEKGSGGQGGNICVRGSMEMSGGAITGGKLQNIDGTFVEDAHGRNLYIRGKAKLTGGTIDGSVRALATETEIASVTLGGDIIIDGAAEGCSNLRLDNGVLAKVEKMTGGKVGITLAYGSGIFTEATDAANAQYFFSDVGSSIVAKDGCLAVGKMACACGSSNGTHNADCDGTLILWEPFGTKAGKSDGYYYLPKDMSGNFTVNSNSVIDLNGFNLTCADDRVMNIGGNVKFINTRPEIREGGMIIGNGTEKRGGAIVVNADAVMTVCDGVTITVDADAAPTNGGALDVAGTLNILGGRVIGTSKATGVGSAIRLNGGKLFASGGAVTDGTVSVQGEGSVTISGTAVIDGLELNGTSLVIDQPGLASGAKIRICGIMGDLVVKRGDLSDDAWNKIEAYVKDQNMVAADASLKLICEQDGLYLRAAVVKVHCLCGDKTSTGNPCADAGHPDLEWGPWDGSFSLSGGNYYLTKDLTLKALSILEDEQRDHIINIDLAGHNWTGLEDRVITQQGETVNITNTGSGGGVITGKGGEKRGGAIAVDMGVMSLYGNVTVRTQSDAAPSYGGAIEVRSKLCIYGATVQGAEVSHSNGGGAICVNGGLLELYSGTVTGAKANIGSAISILSRGEEMGKLALYGGKISNGEVYVKAGCSVHVGGTAVTLDKATVRLRANGDHKIISRDAAMEAAQWDAYKQYLMSGKISMKDEGYTVKIKADGVYIETVSESETVETLKHCLCGDKNSTGNPCADAGHQDLIWQPWEGVSTLETGKNYYLSTDINGKALLSILEGSVNIDLAGHSWTALTGDRAINLDGGSMNICNSAATGGMISGSLAGRGGSICVNGANSVLTLYGNVTIKTEAEATPTYGGAIEVRGKLCIYGATVEGTEVSHSNGGGAICVNGGVMELYSGTVIGGKANVGGAISVITNGEKFGQLKLMGGTIRNGAVYLKTGCGLSVDKNATAFDNGDIVLNPAAEGKLVDKASAMSAEQWAKYEVLVESGKIASKDQTYVLRWKADGIYAELKAAADPSDVLNHCLCGDPAATNNPCADAGHVQLQWLPWDGVSALEAGKNYYLTGDISGTSQISVLTGTVNIDMAGHSWTSLAGERVIYLDGGNVNICNSATTGGVISGGMNGRGGSIGVNKVNSVLTLYKNVTVRTQDDAAPSYGGAIEVRGKLRVYGAVIEGAEVSHNNGGGAICVNGGVLELYSGTVVGGTANIGSAISVITNGENVGELKLMGGTVRDGGIYIKSGCGVYAEGMAVTLDNSAITFNPAAEGKLIEKDAAMHAEQWAKYAEYVTNGQIASKDQTYTVTIKEDGVYAELPTGGGNGDGDDSGSDDPVVHCLCGNSASTGNPCADGGHQALTWIAWDGTQPLEDGKSYYLTGDVQAYINLTSGTVNLDLAGKNLTAPDGSRVIQLGGGDLNITNTANEGGVITGKKDAARGGAVTIDGANSDLVLYSNVTVTTAASATPTSGGVVDVRGNLRLYGATIVGTTASSGTGGAISVSGGNMYLHSGTVVGGTAENGSAIAVVNRDTIYGNLYIYGGKIQNGELYVKSGCTVYVSGTALELDNATVEIRAESEYRPVVKDAAMNATQWGVYEQYLQTGVLATPDTAFVLNTDAEGIYAETASPAPQRVIHCMCGAQTQEGSLCDVCGTNAVEWTAWTGTVEDGKFYYLTGNIDYATDISATIAIDLNGHNWVTTGSRLNTISGNVSITNTAAEGGLVSGAHNVANARGGSIIVGAGATLKLYPGVTVKTTRLDPSYGGVIEVRGTLELRGATVDASNITSYTYGAAICASNNTGVVKLYSGTVIGTAAEGKGSAISAGNDAKTGIVEIYGGTVEGDVFVNAGSSIAVSGAPNIEKLNMNGQKLSVGELKNGAEIMVYNAADAVFVESTAENWDAILGYVSAGYLKPARNIHQIVQLSEGLALAFRDTITHCLCGNHTDTETACAQCGSVAIVYNKMTSSELTAGNYYLTGDVSRTTQLSVNSGTINLDLAGFNWTTNGDRSFYLNGGNMNICSTEAEGQIIGGGNVRGGVVGINNAASSLTLYDGVTVRVEDTAAPTYGGAIEVRGILNIRGAVVVGTTVSHVNGGGAICVNGGTLNLHSGTVIGGTADNGDAISVIGTNGRFNLYGGTITDGDVYLKSGRSIALGEGFTGDTQNPIAITMGEGIGVFATASGQLTLTQDHKSCFTSTQNKTIVLEDNALELQ